MSIKIKLNKKMQAGVWLCRFAGTQYTEYTVQAVPWLRVLGAGAEHQDSAADLTGDPGLVRDAHATHAILLTVRVRPLVLEHENSAGRWCEGWVSTSDLSIYLYSKEESSS